MPCCRNVPEPAAHRRAPLRGWLVLFVALLFGLVSTAWAGSIEPTAAKLTAGEDAYLLSADFNIDLGSRLEETVARGVPLYFVLELEITRNRWFWPGQHVAGRSFNYRLAYIPLTRQYRLTSGVLHQNFATLSEALRVLGRTVALPVVDKSELKIGETYEAALRLSVDRQQLPKPFQVDAIVNKDWVVDAKVLRWTFVPTTPTAEREAK